MTEAKAPQRWYQVRLGRILFFADPSEPGVDRRGNVWAHPGQYVEASHPVLRGIVALQRHKLRQLSEGEVIPAGSFVQSAEGNPYIKGLMIKHDGRQDGGGTQTAEEIVVGDGGASAPPLSADPAAVATAAPPAAPGAPGAPPAVETPSAPPASLSPSPAAAGAAPAPAAPPPPGAGGEAQTLTEDDIGNISL